jgi:hypothetical protein
LDFFHLDLKLIPSTYFKQKLLIIQQPFCQILTFSEVEGQQQLWPAFFQESFDFLQPLIVLISFTINFIHSNLKPLKLAPTSISQWYFDPTYSNFDFYS